MYKLIVAYKSHDLFSAWDYITREMHDFTSIEYLISRYRYNSNKPEYFKNQIFKTKDETKRLQAQSIEELHADAIIFADEFAGLVKLRVGDEVMNLIDYRTTQEIQEQKYADLINKFTVNHYLHNREELEEFKQAVELFDNVGNFDDIEILDYIKGGHANAQNFPILVLVNWERFEDWDGREENRLKFTLVDSALGL